MSDAVFVSEERDVQPRTQRSEPVWSAHGWWTCGRHWGRCSVEASSPVREAFDGKYRIHRDPIRKGWWVAPEAVRYVAVEGVPSGQSKAGFPTMADAEDGATRMNGGVHGYVWSRPDAPWFRWAVIDLHDLGPERVVTTTSADIRCGRCKDIVGPRACGACGGVSAEPKRSITLTRLMLRFGPKPEQCSSPERGVAFAAFDLPLPEGGDMVHVPCPTPNSWHWRVYDDRGVCHVQGDPCDMGMRDHIAIGDRIVIDAVSLVGGRGRIKGRQLSTAVRDAVMEDVPAIKAADLFGLPPVDECTSPRYVVLEPAQMAGMDGRMAAGFTDADIDETRDRLARAPEQVRDLIWSRISRSWLDDVCTHAIVDTHDGWGWGKSKVSMQHGYANCIPHGPGEPCRPVVETETPRAKARRMTRPAVTTVRAGHVVDDGAHILAPTGPSDLRIARAYGLVQREGAYHDAAMANLRAGGFTIDGHKLTHEQVRAAWSRELKRLGREAAERARIPVQSPELEDHEGQDVEDLSGLMDPFVRVWR